ncbi:alpha/beta hydrolase [Streptomyces sp. NPDC001941]|uniref:alpha/beta fold hydrolase n=1 Tax=Streptomyces sp. NPDC001941 TaxID=3154659 RepID=UPI00331BCABD
MSYANVNGLSLYYEDHGAGKPLVLLHGGFGSTEAFTPLLPELGRNRRVILVDLQGHGRTADADRPLRPETLADDVAALLGHLDVPRADVLGYSKGGVVALWCAIRHPDAVRRLVAVSIPYKRDGWYPEVVAEMEAMGGPDTAEALRATPLYETYARLAPRPEDWPVLVAKSAESMRQPFDWSAEVSSVTAPTLLVYGDNDAVRPAHMVEFFGLLGGGHKDAGVDGSGRSAAGLAVLPGATHYDLMGHPALPGVVNRFLAD